jgi:hypothetical protein
VISRDFDFTPAEGWTPEAYEAKKQNLAAALNELHGGLGPELLGVAALLGSASSGDATTMRCLTKLPTQARLSAWRAAEVRVHRHPNPVAALSIRKGRS